MVIIFTIPKVQSYTALQLTDHVNEKYGTSIAVEGFQVQINGDIDLKKVFVQDHHQDTLIYMNRFSTSLTSLASFWNNSVQLRNTNIDKLRFNLKQYKDEPTDNFIHFIEQFENPDLDDEEKLRQIFSLKANYLEASEVHFSATDENRKNPALFSIHNAFLIAEEFSIYGSDIEADIKRITGTTGRQFIIEDLQALLFYSPTLLKLDHLSIITDQSQLKGNLQMKYQRGDFSDFNNKVKWEANFDEASITTYDLAKFYSEFGYGERLLFKGKLKGVLNDFYLEDLQLTGLRNTKINSQQLHFKNTVNQEKAFILEGNFEELQTDYVDLVNLFPRMLGNYLPKELSRFGQFQINGFTRIEGANLQSDFSAKTSIGNAKVKLDFSNLNSQENVRYQGNLSFDKIQLDKLLMDAKYGEVNFDLVVDGKGFLRKYLDTEIQGKIESLEINDYTYTQIVVDGKLKEPKFNGNFSIKDPNMDLNFSGLIDLSEEESLYNFDAKINFIDLRETNLYTLDSIAEIAGNITIDMRGKNINDLKGKIDLNNFIYRNENELLEFEDLGISSSFEGETRYIIVDSPDVIQGKLSGIFQLTELPEITLQAFQNLYYRKNPTTLEEFAYVDFQFNIYNKVIEAIFPKIKFSPGTNVSGSIVANDNYFRLQFNSPQIEAYGNVLSKINLLIDNKDPLINTSLTVNTIKTKLYDISELEIINQTRNDTLFIRAQMKGGKEFQDNYQFQLYQTSTEANELILGFGDSKFSIQKYDWEIKNQQNLTNRIVIAEDFHQIEFDTIVARHEDTFLKLNGMVRDSTYKDVSLGFNNVKLESITPSIDSLSLKGKMNGIASIYQSEGDYKPNINFDISNFEVNNFPLGSVSIFANGDKDLEKFEIQAAIQKDKDTLVQAEGQIMKVAGFQEINAKLRTKELDMRIFSPLGKDVISQMRGLLSGEITLTEKLQAPAMQGTLYLEDGGLSVPYLNIDYDFLETSEINVLKNAFVFTGVRLKDTKYQSLGSLDGLIGHSNFSDWELDLNIAGSNFVALDTEFEEGKLYYGTAFITGNAEIVGPTDNLVINVNARTNENTLFRIPLDDSEFLADASFIYFLTEEDKQVKADGRSLEIREVKGLSMNFDLDITEDAEVEIVVDKESGSTLRGRGSGNLLIEIDTNGKFNMYGDFEAKQGIYDFKYAGLVNKKFNVLPGGTLTWNGNPLEANMNIEAVYRTQANPAMILENPSINRDIPIEVSILLNGALVQPEINFEINYPNLSSIVKSELDYRIQGQDNVELQAISLVAQGTFYNVEGIGAQAAIAGNLVEGASGLIDKLFADDEGRFKVGLNYTQAQRIPDQNQTGDRVGMSFQTQISDRVFINGRFGVPVGGTTESFVFGDVEVNLLLNESGSLRANAFNRESDIQFIGEELGYTQGVGLSYSVDFQNFRDLLRKVLKKEAIRQPQTEKESTENLNDKENKPTSVLPDYIKLPNEN